MNRPAQIILSFIVFLLSLGALFSALFQWNPLYRLIFFLLTGILYFLQVWLEKNNII